MTLIVEDGTGLPDADSYVSVDEFKALAANFGIDISTLTDEQIEINCRTGTLWVDTAYRYKGIKMTAAQALEFPRTGCVDWSGYPAVGVPGRVKQATVYMSGQAALGPLYVNADRGGMITNERVGPLHVTYADGAPAQRVYGTANNLLAPYIYEDTASVMARDKNMPLGGPFPGGQNVRKDTVFDLGMHDNPGYAPPDADPLP